MKNLVTILTLALSLPGCAPRFNFSVPDIVPSKQKINTDLENMTIFYGATDTAVPVVIIKVDELSKEQLSQEVIPAWGIALRDGIKRSELFDKSARKKVNLSVEIKEIDTPFFGVNFTTYVLANYKLIDKANNATLYDEDIKSEATVPWNYSFTAQKRATESINRAVQKNISTFIYNIQSHKPLS